MNVAEEGRVARPQPPEEVLEDHSIIDGRRLVKGEDDLLDPTGNPDARLVDSITQWPNSERIAKRQEASLALIRKDNSEIPAQPTGERVSPPQVGMNKQFAELLRRFGTQRTSNRRDVV